MRGLIFVIFSIAIFLCSSSIFANDLIGPKIYGLQIGMPAADAKPIIEEVCKKENINCKEETEGRFDPMMFYGDNAKGVEAWGAAGYNVMMYFKNNTLVGYTLPLTVFNLRPGIDFNTFLQQLSDHYNLSLSKGNYGGYIEKNNELGYQVKVTGCISVSTIPKTDSLQFK